MVGKLTHVIVVVADYDEALAWYTEKLGLEPRMDNAFGEGARFVTVAAPGQDVEIVLHKPFGGSDQQPGGNGGFVFSSDDCRRDAAEIQQRGVRITQGPEDVPWGVQAVFEDIYGNCHVIVELGVNAPPF